MPILARGFYSRPTLTVARALLGQLLVRRVAGVRLVARIVETEAYLGEDDPASHAAPGPTARNAVMFGPPGFAYVYFTYGMHYCMNVVTGPAGTASAVLLRAAEPLEGLEKMRLNRGLEEPRLLTSGPARLAQAFGLTRDKNGADLTQTGGLCLLKGPRRREKIGVSPRIGIRKAVDHPWRFYLEDNPFVSRRR